MKSIISIILLVGAIGLFFAYTNPKYQQVKALKTEIASYEEALEQSKTILAKRADLQREYNNFKETDRQSLEKLLPSNVDNVKLVLDMNSIAKRYGMALKGIVIDENTSNSKADGSIVASRSGYGSMVISFGVTASYDNFTKFLRDLERSLRIVDVTRLSFKSTENGVYDYSVTLRTYWLNK